MDDYFSTWFEIHFVHRQEERNGIDRIFKNKKTGKTEKIEYKTDFLMSKTNNFFFETVSVDKRKEKTELDECEVEALGWLYTSKSDRIIYFDINNYKAYIFKLCNIQKYLQTWIYKYKKRCCYNRDYVSRGVLIPLQVILNTDFVKVAEFDLEKTLELKNKISLYLSSKNDNHRK